MRRVSAFSVAHKHGSHGMERSVWQVMVVRLKLHIAWGTESYAFTVVFPPILVLSVSAASIFSGLYLHPTAAPIWRAINFLVQHSKFTASFCETDAAAPNLKMGAVILENVAETQYHGHWFCSLHQAQLCEVSVTSSLVKLKLISRLYSLSLLLETGGLFSRLKAYARHHVRESLVYMRGPPPADGRVYAREVMNYMVTHYYRYAVTVHKRHHWLNSVSLDGVAEEDIQNVDVLGEGMPKLKHKAQYQTPNLSGACRPSLDPGP